MYDRDTIMGEQHTIKSERDIVMGDRDTIMGEQESVPNQVEGLSLSGPLPFLVSGFDSMLRGNQASDEGL
jgi:hypothetical protein